MSDAIFAAYFESEAARPMVHPGDHAFAAAVNRISDDDGRSFRAWLAGADDHIKRTVSDAYAARIDVAQKTKALRWERAAAIYAEERAKRTGGNAAKAALRKARAVCSDFVAPR